MKETQKCINAMDYVGNWVAWKGHLKDAIKQGKKFGMSDEMIKTLSVKVADFLAKRVCPATPEEKLMIEMWDVATPDERKTLATIMFKIIDK
ncbi:MAG: DUF3243 domain-containing protein [Methanocellales archaeon]|nr:DUF3243 domain-containing protein [Methanocellales archaeon]MDD3421745.1 DUF3243 domain-containing protein [Methanocellales archaeon]MDD4898766.1 DUF3243 domain-containing protein [Methanocellales archaeon]MDD5446526.1 DUF3243 domain-containing protein [Methanocellales archaeon]